MAAAVALCALTAGPATALPWPYSEAGIANHNAAREDAQHLLAGLRLPPNASLASTEPTGTPPILDHGPGQKPATLVDATSWWTIPGEPKQVVAWMVANPPTEAFWIGSGTAVTFETEETAKIAEFAWPAIHNVLLRRTLVAAAVPGPPGSSILRADALVTWFLPRPPEEHIPNSAQILEVVDEHIPTTTIQLVVSRRRTVRRIVDLLNRLPASAAGGTACPQNRPNHRLRLAFRANPAGPVLAEANQVLPALGDCQPLDLSIGGKPQMPLGEGQAVYKALKPMLTAKRAR